MSAFDAAVLLVADGLVAVGRVLGGLRARCAAEKHADTLAVFEEDRDALEPGELLVDDKGRPPGYYVSLDPKFATKHFGFPANPESHSYTAWDGGEWLYQPAGKYVARWEAMSYPTDGDPYARIKAAERSAAVSTPAADNTTDCGCGSGTKCPDPITCPDAVAAAMAEDTAAADGTDLVDAIAQLIDYHQAFTPYVVAAEPQRRVACQGCSWRGADHAEHTRHLAALVADMKNATHRIQEQLGGAS